jgi:hypothetical protein
VADELQDWRDVVHQSASTLSAPHNDWIEFSGPSARAVLEAADQALKRLTSAAARAVSLLDAEFERKTSANPFADPALPWWQCRWSY